MQIDKTFPIGVIGAGVLGSKTIQAFNEWCVVRVNDRVQRLSSYTMKDVATLSELVFVCVPAPLLFSGKGVDTQRVLEACYEIASYNAEAKIVIRSIMPVGGTKEGIRRLNKVLTKEIQLVYSPEFFVIGDPSGKGLECPVVSTLSKLYTYRYGVVPLVESVEAVESMEPAAC